MAGQHRFQSVATMMRKQPSAMEARLIKPAWAPKAPFKAEGHPRPN